MACYHSRVPKTIYNFFSKNELTKEGNLTKLSTLISFISGRRMGYTSLLYFIFGLLFTLCSTVVLFALVNYGLQKIDPLSFYSPNAKSILFFLYYSFNTVLTNGVADFYPLSAFARLLNSLELLFGFLIVVILFFMYTNIKNDKAKEELDNVVKSLDVQSKEIEKYINTEYSTDIEDAISELEKIPGNFIKIIYYFSNQHKK